MITKSKSAIITTINTICLTITTLLFVMGISDIVSP
jgi:hypothetical protein